jgi:hypothetical protein
MENTQIDYLTCLSEKIVKEFQEFFIFWKAKDYTEGGKKLNRMIETYPALEIIALSNIDFAMQFFEFFVETNLDMAPDNTAARNLYLKIAYYILENGTPEIQQNLQAAIKHCFPELEPNGFDENGELLYCLNDLADAFDMTPEEILQKAESMPNARVIIAKAPEPGETIH